MRCSSGTQAVTGAGLAPAGAGASAAAIFALRAGGAAGLPGPLGGAIRIGRREEMVAVLASPSPTAISGRRKAGPARGMMAEPRPPGTREVKLTDPLPFPVPSPLPCPLPLRDA